MTRPDSSCRNFYADKGVMIEHTTDPNGLSYGIGHLFKSFSNIRNRGHPCLGLAAIFAGMLYNVQIIQKSSTWNIMHVSIIVLELPAKLQWVID